MELYIDSTIFVEKQSQKGMLIGKFIRLKAIGIDSLRKELEQLLETKVMLKTWVKVKKAVGLITKLTTFNGIQS